MKFVFIIGNSAVGKMTVGQELMKITDLRLFHNHMAIDPVLEVFGEFDGKAIKGIREAIFKRFAETDNYGLIYTYMMAFDEQEDWDYLEHVKTIFKPDTEFYYVELIASQDIRLERNKTENRLNNKPSKRNIDESDDRLISADKNYRCVSYEGEITFPNYLRIDNSNLEPSEVAKMIKDRFNL